MSSLLSMSSSSSSSSKWGRRTMQQQPSSSSSSRHGSSRHHPTRKSSSNPAPSAVITDADPSLSSTSSTVLLGRSLSSSYHSASMIETIPEDHEVFSSSSNSHALGPSLKRSTVPVLPAQSHRQRMDALDLSSSTSPFAIKGSGQRSKANCTQASSSPGNVGMTGRFFNTAEPSSRSSSSSSCFDIDTFHVGLNQCDAEALPKLRRLRESNPIVITEDDDDDADGSANANAKAAAGVLPYRALQVFPGASHWWYHPYYYPTSALMRGQS
jgi:hypothetical protein